MKYVTQSSKSYISELYTKFSMAGKNFSPLG